MPVPKTQSLIGLRIEHPDVTAQGRRTTPNPPPDLTRAIDAWPDLSEPIKAGVVATVRPQTSVMNRLPGTSPLRFQPFVEGAPAARVIFE